MKTFRDAVIVCAVALALFGFRLKTPNHEVFDEVIYPKAAVAMMHGENLEPSHPPLGKMVMAAAINTFGDNVIAWRLPSVISGALIVSAIFCWTLVLTSDRWLSYWASAITLVNGTLFTASRWGCLDAIATMFLFWGIVIASGVILGKLSPNWQWTAGALFGLAMSCKWLSLFPLLLFIGILIFKTKSARPAVRMLIPFVAVYVASFAVFAQVLHKPFGFGWSGIWAHIPYIAPQNMVSEWWEWPFMIRPMIVFEGPEQWIYHLGNPVVMWVGFVATVILAMWLIARKVCRLDAPAYWWIPAVVFAVLFLQYAVMPLESRFYHYYLAAGLCFGPILAMLNVSRRTRIAFLALAVFSFVLMYPTIAAVPGGRWI